VPVTVKRAQGESFEATLRKFNRRLQQSGILSVAKKKMFWEKKLTKRERREQALRKALIKNLKKKRLISGR